jgi:hypothetical protein
VAEQYTNLVQAVYKDSLGREATATEVEFWEYKVSMEGAGVLVDALEQSDKYRIARIISAFEATLGYTPSSSQLSTHLTSVKNGTRKIDDVEPFLLANPSYYKHVGGTDEAYVTALYQHMLHRAPTATQLDHWVARLSTLGRTGVVNSLWDNPQSVRLRVIETYQHYLGVTPTSTQVEVWVQRLSAGESEAALRRAIMVTSKYLTYAASRY